MGNTNNVNQPNNNPRQNQIRSQHPSRLTSYIDFRVSDEIIHFLEVSQSRLYFRGYDKSQTVKKIQHQYEKIHKRNMVLESNDLIISPDIPLCEIVTSLQSRIAFSNILDRMQSQNKQMSAKNLCFSPLEHQIYQKCSDFDRHQYTITMRNAPNKSILMTMGLKNSQCFKSLIHTLNFHPRIHGSDIQFYDIKDNRFNQQLYDIPFSDFQHGTQLTARYSYKNSLIRGNSLVLVNGKKEIPISQLKQNKEKVDIMSYKEDQKKMDFNQITHLKNHFVKKYFRLTMSDITQKLQNRKDITFQSTGSVRILLLSGQKKGTWFPVKDIKKGDLVGGVDKQANKIISCEIRDSQEIFLEQPQYFYSLEALPSHQYIANSVIVHNSDTFQIMAYYMKGKDKVVKEVRFQLDETLSKYFQDKICKVSGFTLNNNFTFGDYQLDRIQIIYVYEQQQQIFNKQEFTVSQWKREKRKNSKMIQQLNLIQDRNKLEEEYLVVHKNKIYPYSQIMKIKDVQQLNIFNILVANRIFLERSNYFLNFEPQYEYLEDQVYKKYSIIRQQDIKNNTMLRNKEKFAIYLYTTNEVYRQLNSYLRTDYITQKSKESNLQFLPLTSWITKSALKEDTYSGLVYRGIEGICLDAALGLDTNRHINQDPNNPNSQHIGKIIMFTSFTSTSTTKEGTKNFTGNVFLTLHVQSGKSIQKISEFSHEKQVLILPFTYFVISKYNCQTTLQTAELQQVPMPRTNLRKIIFWVDDIPTNNTEYIKEYFDPADIQVVQITSTRIMKVILSNFIGFFKYLDRKVVIISDMVRKQQGQWNYTAGVDLFLQIYNTYGLSNKAIIFATDKIKAIDNIRKKGVIDGNWVITNNSDQLVKQVMEEFKRQ